MRIGKALATGVAEVRPVVHEEGLELPEAVEEAREAEAAAPEEVPGVCAGAGCGCGGRGWLGPGEGLGVPELVAEAALLQARLDWFQAQLARLGERGAGGAARE
ncbi:hypothetical protein [Streptomyces sp. TRM68367]|uniref:hypothetical protein n=1 Tax=Streptomyces sp. TRM68367 TaxID=2758415 RepID=UPI00165AF441|nr:hypothetical protein [Streptomyces sp. TRM68367]MBC9724740.1 hypothetical protein [Streptomyces sp. TRM68367]